MTKQIFERWLTEEYIPGVVEMKKNEQYDGSTVLFIDNFR
jgi:hypothetical protein